MKRQPRVREASYPPHWWAAPGRTVRRTEEMHDSARENKLALPWSPCPSFPVVLQSCHRADFNKLFLANEVTDNEKGHRRDTPDLAKLPAQVRLTVLRSQTVKPSLAGCLSRGRHGGGAEADAHAGAELD